MPKETAKSQGSTPMNHNRRDSTEFKQPEVPTEDEGQPSAQPSKLLQIHQKFQEKLQGL